VDDDELVKLYNPAAKSHNASHLAALRAVYERGVEDGRASIANARAAALRGERASIVIDTGNLPDMDEMDQAAITQFFYESD